MNGIYGKFPVKKLKTEEIQEFTGRIYNGE